MKKFFMMIVVALLRNSRAVNANTNVEFMKTFRFRIRDFTRRIKVRYRKNDRDFKNKSWHDVLLQRFLIQQIRIANFLAIIIRNRRDIVALTWRWSFFKRAFLSKQKNWITIYRLFKMILIRTTIIRSREKMRIVL
jgi:hypothetical protein